MALSKADKTYIREHYLLQTHEEMSIVLNKTSQTISSYCSRYGLHKSKEANPLPDKALISDKPFEMLNHQEQLIYAKYDLQSSPMFDQLKKQFSNDEINKFVDTWTHYYVQFKGEITPTEKTQITSAVQYEIIMSRNLIMKKELLDTIYKMRNMIDAENLLGENKDLTKILDLEREIANNMSLQTQLTKEFNDAQSRHSSIFKDLKATRDQRIQSITNATKDFFSLVKELQRRDVQAKEARYMELGRLAAEKERRKLMELHSFQDGSVDHIIFTSETLEEQAAIPELEDSEDD